MLKDKIEIEIEIEIKKKKSTIEWTMLCEVVHNKSITSFSVICQIYDLCYETGITL